MAIATPEFLEPVPSRVEDLPGLGIADSAMFRDRVRMNRALPKVLVCTDEEEAAEFERVVGDDDLLPFYVLELGARLGAAVCKVGFDDEKDGTGFLIGPDILVTNNHVIETPTRARQARCIFDYQLGVERKPLETVMFKLDPDALFITSDARTGLDYTFVRIDAAASTRYGVVPVSRGSFTNVEREFAHIVQHPDGKMKRVAYRDNRIMQDSGVTVRYTADTMPGSSGSPVFNNDWQLVGLHHSAIRVTQAEIDAQPGLAGYKYLNEAIKFAAIASDLEQRLGAPEAAAAREVLACFRDTDSLLGYFGVLGRPTDEGATGLEKVVKGYSGEAHDIDVGFWNVEWFSNRYLDKTADVAKVVAELQLDVYALSESSPAAVAHLANHLQTQYGLDMAWEASEPGAPDSKQSTTLLWNRQTVERIPAKWPAEVEPWFQVRSQDFGDLQLEAVHGKIFDRYPALYRFRALNREGLGAPFDFNLVPLHLKAMTEGALRRAMAARILGAAIGKTTALDGEADWLVGGDFNAELATGDFSALMESMTPISAQDEDEGAMTYLKAPNSLIDHIFISPNLAKTYGAKDFFIVAADTKTPDYVKKISDHRPALVRLSLKSETRSAPATSALPDGLAAALAVLDGTRVS